MRAPCMFVAIGIALGLLTIVRATTSNAADDGVTEKEAAEATPVGLRVLHDPIPFEGSDAAFHVVYEVEVTNFTPLSVTLDSLDVLDADRGDVVTTLNGPAIAGRLVVPAKGVSPGSLEAAQQGLYMHLTVPAEGDLPRRIRHRARVHLEGNAISESTSATPVARPSRLVLDPPLRGGRFIAADGCCDSVRHVRATLPLHGQRTAAQRFAIDWEQFDDRGRIYAGDPTRPSSYVIYGQKVYAVADGSVADVFDELNDSPPGKLPPGLTIVQADGNHVVMSIGNGLFALYAHMQRGSIRVKKGDRVHQGDVIGLVGTTGNSSEPHLHFHVTAGPEQLTDDGVPYAFRPFRTSERVVSTAALDQAIIDGSPIAREPTRGDPEKRNVMPMDLSIVDWLE
jgi:murein DD-endopeptidase MepM/ murein hydrolase activator NlpD